MDKNVIATLRPKINGNNRIHFFFTWNFIFGKNNFENQSNISHMTGVKFYLTDLAIRTTVLCIKCRPTQRHNV